MFVQTLAEVGQKGEREKKREKETEGKQRKRPSTEERLEKTKQ